MPKKDSLFAILESWATPICVGTTLVTGVIWFQTLSVVGQQNTKDINKI